MGYNYQQDALAVGRTNGEASSTIPKRRVVAAVGTSTTDDLVGLLVSGNVAKMYGVSGDSDIAAGKVGDVYIEGIVPVESDGSAVINPGEKLTASTTADATQGRVKTAAPAAGVNSEIIGIAESYAPATAGYVVMVRIQRSTMQGA
jgi:hypothetical protein